MTAKVYETPGNVGILSKSTYLFVCGAFYQNLELNAANLAEAEAKARGVAGWENGFATCLGAMSGARGTPSTWRCEECVAESRRLPPVYDPMRHEWRRA